jgi:hypothetical protein
MKVNDWKGEVTDLAVCRNKFKETIGCKMTFLGSK